MISGTPCNSDALGIVVRAHVCSGLRWADIDNLSGIIGATVDA